MLVSLDAALLIPQPTRVEPARGTFPLTGARIQVVGPSNELVPVARRLQRDAREVASADWPIGLGGTGGTGEIRLAIDDIGSDSTDAYLLTVTPDAIDIRAATPAGVFYGTMTLVQLLRQSSGALPSGRIVDAPRFAMRGVMLDVSRNKVPTLDTLFMLVDELAELKVNQLQLYIEHTFAYPRHEDVWALASPLTGEDILRLGERCRENFIDLVPNQNSFGHLHRWLERPAYRHLAETDTWVHPRGHTVHSPFSLCPTDAASLEFLRELYGDLLPYFDSKYFNVGCDETWDVGQGRSRAECELLGKGRVYLNFLTGVDRLVREQGRRTMAWADIIIQYPQLVAEVPDEMILLEWGYEADHPFDENCRLIAATGKEFMVCPGTSSWNAITGRTDNCLGNLAAAARAGLEHGARGYLITDWGDRGHWHPLALSYLGFAAGAWHAWSGEGPDRSRLTRALDLHVFHDRAGHLADAAFDLGNAYLHTERSLHNGTALFHLLYDPLDTTMVDGERRIGVQALELTLRHLASAAEGLAAAGLDRPDGDLLVREFSWSARLASHACHRGLLAWQDGREARLRLNRELRLLAGEFQDLWLSRFRPGGLSDSFQALVFRAEEYLSEETTTGATAG